MQEVDNKRQKLNEESVLCYRIPSKTAIVSPKALDNARTVAAIMPETDFLRITFFTVCHLVAP